jgi:hypothetical protein
MAISLLFLAAALTLGGPPAAQAQPRQWTMTGRVLAAENGAPLAGCTVTADGHQATGYDLGSGEDGVVQLEQPLMPGRYEIMVNNRAVVSELRHLEVPDLPDAALAPLRIVVKPVPAVATAAGRVVDADGKPVADYLLYAEATTPDGKRTTIAARSDADGRFELIAGALDVGPDQAPLERRVLVPKADLAGSDGFRVRGQSDQCQGA